MFQSMNHLYNVTVYLLLLLPYPYWGMCAVSLCCYDSLASPCVIEVNNIEHILKFLTFDT